MTAAHGVSYGSTCIPRAARRRKGREAPQGSVPVSPDQMIAMLQARSAELRRTRPGNYLVPNAGQARFIGYLRRKPFPKDLIFMGGNGAGKTVVGAKVTAAITFGPKHAACGPGIKETYPGDHDFEAWTLFRERAKRENRPIYGRIIATAASLKGNGALMQRIKAFWPRGLWQAQKLGMPYVSQFMCWDNEEDVGDEDKACAIWDVKTIDQDVIAHAGPDMDVIWFDEPSTKDVYAENVGRCRGNPYAIRIHTLTPLELAGWLIDDLVNEADGIETVVVYGSLWDNCRDWHPDATMWSGGEVGVGEVLTNGALESVAIRDLIKRWKKQSPATLEARLYGKPTHLMGSVYKNYSAAVHHHEGIELPVDWEEYPIWRIMDPHHSRAPAVAWFVRVMFNGKPLSMPIGEYPNSDYTKLESSISTHQKWAEEIRQLEEQAGISDRIRFSYGDPNSLLFKYATKTDQTEDALTLQDIYRNSGLDFDLAIDNMVTGHECVSQMLYFDPEREIGEGNYPEFLVPRKNYICGGEMINIPNSLSRYAFKAKALADNRQTNLKTIVAETYKDFADVLRYFARMAKDEPVVKIADTVSEFSRIQASRERVLSSAKNFRR